MAFLTNKILLNIFMCGLILSSPLFAEPIAQVASKNPPKEKERQQVQWKKFTSTESGFSAELPTQPEHIEQKIDIPKTGLSIEYDTYISEPSESVVYVVSVWNYPQEIDMSKPEVNLKDGFGGMLTALPGSEVQEMQMTEVQGYKALEFLVKNENIYFQGKLILVYNTLYQVFVVYKDSENMKKDYSRFINSFKLVNPEKRKTENQKNNDTTATNKMNV